MNLVVDFGNTRIKAAQFEGNQLLQKKYYKNINELVDDHHFYSGCSNAIISSVTQEHPLLVNILGNKDKVLLFQASTPIPITSLYQSAATLGSDRLAASVGSFMLYPDRNVLTIDAGTCIKYNFVNAKAEYLGGAISPGIPMRLKAMHHFTSRLPEIAPDYNYEKLTGNSTVESLLSGALIGAVSEVDGCIERYRNLYVDLTVVVTGGDGAYLCKQLKNPIFANPDIVLSGLNSILNYNIEK